MHPRADCRSPARRMHTPLGAISLPLSSVGKERGGHAWAPRPLQQGLGFSNYIPTLGRAVRCKEAFDRHASHGSIYESFWFTVSPHDAALINVACNAISGPQQLGCHHSGLHSKEGGVEPVCLAEQSRKED